MSAAISRRTNRLRKEGTLIMLGTTECERLRLQTATHQDSLVKTESRLFIGVKGGKHRCTPEERKAPCTNFDGR